MSDINVEEELIDYEPAGTTITDNESSNTGDHASAHGTPRATRRRHRATHAAANDGTKRNGRSHARRLGKSFTDIAAGNTVGSYPAIERLIGPSAAGRPTAAFWAARGGRQPCPDESSAAAPSRGYITDIRPPVKERLAIVEHELADAEGDIKQVRVDMYYTMREVEKRANHEIHEVDKRIDRDVLPLVDTIQRKGTVKLTLSVIALLLSLAANTIALYRHFIIR